MMLSVRSATVRIDGRAILDRASIEVERGELLVVVGPNGAGKSTLLNVMAGDLEPSSGDVLIDDKPVGDLSVLTLARSRAVQMQEQRLAFGFRVIDVVRMGRTPWARTEHEDQDESIVADAVERVDLEPFVDRSFPTLSGGEKARTGFARIRAQRTDLVLLDEPTAALDIKYQERVLDEARALADAGHAVVAVLHDLSLAAAHADRIAVVSRGCVVADGAPLDVLTSERLSAVYDHPVDVVQHHGLAVVIPRRGRGHPTEPPNLEEPCAT